LEVTGVQRQTKALSRLQLHNAVKLLLVALQGSRKFKAKGTHHRTWHIACAASTYAPTQSRDFVIKRLDMP
jgi:hypothetical protein